MPQLKFTARSGQNLLDVALMTYGDLNSVYKMLQDNGIESINETRISQKEFVFNSEDIVDNGIYYKNRNQNIFYTTNIPEVITGKSYNNSYNKSYH